MRKCIVVGCGWAGMRHIEAITDHEDAVLAGVCDVDGEKLSRVTKKYGVPGYGSIKELECADFDTAMVCTLPILHKDQCLEFIGMGKDILCEKPVCRASADIEEIAEAAAEKGVRVGVVFNQRNCFPVKKAKELLDESGGRIHLITASMYQEYPKKTGGHIEEDFIVTDACCHLADLMTYLCGGVKNVSAHACKVDSEIFSDIVASIEFENGCVGSLSHTAVGGKFDSQHPAMQIDVHTENFHLVIENFSERLRVFPHNGYGQTVYEPSVFSRRDYQVSLHTAVRDYIDALNRSEAPPVGIQAAIENMRIIEAIKKSYADKKYVYV